MKSMRESLDDLYHGGSRRGVTFRWGLLAFDVATILFFVVSSTVHLVGWVIAVDFAIAAVLAADYLAQLYIAKDRLRHVTKPFVLADLVVIGSLLAPAFTESMTFLRVIRVLRLLRSYHVLKELRDSFKFFRRNEEVIQAAINLFVFIFFVTALVYVLEARLNPQINTYIDALYFTVTTLTTTGFGDITLQDTHGRLLSVVIMVVGVALFLRLVQSIFRPRKVQHECPACGLKRHDPDAVHCKHCGLVLHIENDGDWE